MKKTSCGTNLFKLAMGITEYSLGYRGVCGTYREAVGPEPAKISNDEFISRQQRLFSQLRPNDLLIILHQANLLVQMM